MLRKALMRLNTSLVVAASLMIATPAWADDAAKEVEQAVHALQAAFQEGDSKTISALVTDDHVSILSYAQFYGRADLLAHLPQYRISNHTVVLSRSWLEMRVA
jgi:hypothetical protein